MKRQIEKKGMVGREGKEGRSAPRLDPALTSPEHLGNSRALHSRMVPQSNIQSHVHQEAVSPSLQQALALAPGKLKADFLSLIGLFLGDDSLYCFAVKCPRLREFLHLDCLCSLRLLYKNEN